MDALGLSRNLCMSVRRVVRRSLGSHIAIATTTLLSYSIVLGCWSISGAVEGISVPFAEGTCPIDGMSSEIFRSQNCEDRGSMIDEISVPVVGCERISASPEVKILSGLKERDACSESVISDIG